MKHSFLYHPLFKGAVLVLFALSLVFAAFFGLRLSFMRENGVFAGPEEFYPSHEALMAGNETGLRFPVLESGAEILVLTPGKESPRANDSLSQLLLAALLREIEADAPLETVRQREFVYPKTETDLFSTMVSGYEKTHSNLVFRITDIHTGEILFSNMEDIYDGGTTEDVYMNDSWSWSIFLYTEKEEGGSDGAGESLPSDVQTGTAYDYSDYCEMVGISSENIQRARVCAYIWGVRGSFGADDAYRTFYLACTRDYDRVPALVIACSVCAAVAVLAFITLLSVTGVTPAGNGIRLSWIDRMPFEPVALVKLGMLFGALVLLRAWYLALGSDMRLYIFGYVTPPTRQAEWAMQLLSVAGIAAVLLVGLLVLWCGAALTRRIAAGGFLANTLTLRFARLCRSFFASVPLLWTWILFCDILWLLSLLFGRGMAIVATVAVFFGVCYVIWQLERVGRGTKEIADGAFEHQIELAHLWGAPKHMAENLNRIGAVMSHAVDERMKSERFRTELITNVSHDIKTPLTSIIGYTDLLTKEEPENERMREYINVLSRQSARLKKLICDLLDASKASSGALQVSLAELDAAEILRQMVGEYEERLSSVGLTPVLSMPEEGMHILADGRHLWRVLDNLMSNVLKYSMRGTRVYLTVDSVDGYVRFTFKNISAVELLLDASELTERFVRGDASRHTEGSGLGLAIAKSLTELQGGKLHVAINADLFSVSVSFPQAEKEE